MKRVACCLVLALTLMACAADSQEQDPASEPASSATPAPAPTAADPPAPSSTSQAVMNAIPDENTKHATSLCTACGPLPDPWRALEGPLPDPWTDVDPHK